MTPLVDEVDDDQDANPDRVEPFVSFFDKLLGVEKRLFTIEHTPILPQSRGDSTSFSLPTVASMQVHASPDGTAARYSYAHAATIAGWSEDVVEHSLARLMEIHGDPTSDKLL